jgi:hypothetical protein
LKYWYLFTRQHDATSKADHNLNIHHFVNVKSHIEFEFRENYLIMLQTNMAFKFCGFNSSVTEDSSLQGCGTVSLGFEDKRQYLLSKHHIVTLQKTCVSCVVLYSARVKAP